MVAFSASLFGDSSIALASQLEHLILPIFSLLGDNSPSGIENYNFQVHYTGIPL